VPTVRLTQIIGSRSRRHERRTRVRGIDREQPAREHNRIVTVIRNAQRNRIDAFLFCLVVEAVVAFGLQRIRTV